MLRQMWQAVRFAVADFFDVPWQAVALWLLAIALCVGYGLSRLLHFGPSAWSSLFLCGLVATLYVWRRFSRR